MGDVRLSSRARTSAAGDAALRTENSHRALGRAEQLRRNFGSSGQTVGPGASLPAGRGRLEWRKRKNSVVSAVSGVAVKSSNGTHLTPSCERAERRWLATARSSPSPLGSEAPFPSKRRQGPMESPGSLGLLRKSQEEPRKNQRAGSGMGCPRHWHQGP